MSCPRFLAGNMKSGRKKQWLVATAIAIAIGAILVLLLDRSPSTPERATSDSLLPTTSIEAVAPASPPSSTPGDSGAAWVVVDPDTVVELPPYKEVVVGRALVRISGALQLGTISDRVVLAVPQLGQDYEGVIEQVDVDPWGNVSYVGLIRDVDDREYRFLITAGALNTFAHIGTSRGTFELVATDSELGWLMPTANMDQHVDYSKPDYYIPGENGQRENELPP